MSSDRAYFLEAELLLTYYCHGCGEDNYILQDFMDFLLTREFRKPPKCLVCGGTDFTLKVKESYISSEELREAKRRVYR